jgi:hypothetical protein
MPRKSAPPEIVDRIESELDRLDPAPTPPRPARAPRRKIGPVERGVRSDLKDLPPDLRKGAIAAAMIELAQMMDLHVLDPRNQSGHAREIRQSMTALREMTGGEHKGDHTDDLRDRREQRLLASSPG